MAGEFLVGRLDRRVNAHGARVEFFDQPLDRPTLASGVGAFGDDDERMFFVLGQLELEFDEPELLFLELGLISAFVDDLFLVEMIQADLQPSGGNRQACLAR